MFLIRFPFYFALSFAILSIPLGKKRVFDHLVPIPKVLLNLEANGAQKYLMIQKLSQVRP